MSKYYSILGNFHIHKEVSEASTNIILRKNKETR